MGKQKQKSKTCKEITKEVKESKKSLDAIREQCANNYTKDCDIMIES